MSKKTDSLILITKSLSERDTSAANGYDEADYSIQDHFQIFFTTFSNGDHQNSLKILNELIERIIGVQNLFNIIEHENLIQNILGFIASIYENNYTDDPYKDLLKNLWVLLQILAKDINFHQQFIDNDIFTFCFQYVDIGDADKTGNILRLIGILIQNPETLQIFQSSHFIENTIEKLSSNDLTEIDQAKLNQFFHFLKVVLQLPIDEELVKLIVLYYFEMLSKLDQDISQNLDNIQVILSVFADVISKSEPYSKLVIESEIMSNFNQLLNDPRFSLLWKAILSINVNVTNILSSQSDEYKHLVKSIPIERIIEIFSEQPFDPQALFCLKLLNNLCVDNQEIANEISQNICGILIHLIDSCDFRLKLDIMRLFLAFLYQGNFNFLIDLSQNGKLFELLNLVSANKELQKYFCISMLNFINSGHQIETIRSVIDLFGEDLMDVLDEIDANGIAEASVLISTISQLF